MTRVGLLLLAALLLSSCLGDWGVDDEKFPCRAPEDCADDFICDPIRFICVQKGSETPADGGVGGAG